MHGIPAIKKANGLLDEVRKDLSDKKVAELNQLLTELDRVKGDDLVEVLSQQGLILSYLNEPKLASEKFLASYSIDGNEISLANSINALNLINEDILALEKGFSFLKKNPNNPRIFRCLSRSLISCHYPEYFIKLESYSKYHLENEDLIATFNTTKFANNIFNNLDIQTKILNKILFIVVSEIRKTFFKQPCQPAIWFDEEEECAYYQIVDLPSYDDILILNNSFEAAIQQLIDSGELDFDEYVDSISKLVIGFKANPNKRIA